MTVNAVSGKAALVVAHPGHELCVYGWLERARPLVFVLTDGSGRAGTSRLDSTAKVVARAGARVGSVYGRFADLDLYAAILRRDFALFERLAAELAGEFVREGIGYVAGDAAEGYNPVHDACRAVINAAAELATRKSGRPVVSLDFTLFRRHKRSHAATRDGAIRLTLDDAQLERKLSLAREYPELEGEVAALLDRKALDSLRAYPELSRHIDEFVTGDMGTEAYREECLRVAGGAAADGIPFYEMYGEVLVASGAYDQAIRRREHVEPLADALRRYVEAES